MIQILFPICLCLCFPLPQSAIRNPQSAIPIPFAALAGGSVFQAVYEPAPKRDAYTQTVLGTTALVLMGNAPAAPLTEIAFLQGGDHLGCWTLVNTDLARPIPPIFLARFTKPGPLPDLTNNVFEYDALCYALLLAAKNTPEAFQKSAAANHRVSYAMLFEQPTTVHRGKPIHVEGDVQWVNQLETPTELKQAGLDHLYEVWIVNPVVARTPYSVLLTELPPDLPIGKRLKVPVVLDGYFLKRREEPENVVPVKAWQNSLLIAARSLTVQKTLALMVTSQGRGAVGAATLVMSGTSPGGAPLTEVSLLRYGERAGCWTLVNSDVVRPLAAETLAKIKDGKTLPDSSSQGMEFDALLEVLVQTWYTSPAAFEKAGRKDLSFASLFQQPDHYRGDVVHIEGRLRLVQRWDPPVMAREAGVPMMYEAAIFDDASGGNPYIVFVMEPPDGIPLNQKVSETVAFDGYFYKKWRYKSLDSLKATEFREAPLLIGRALKVRKGTTAPAATEETAGWLLPTIAVGVGVLTIGVGVMFVMAFWLRRSDAQVQNRLHAVRTSTFALPPPDEPFRKDEG